jgi:hypothetical protein
MEREFRDFSELYRAAFAELRPERKLTLLAAVQRAIEDWERGANMPSPEMSRAPEIPRAAFAEASLRQTAVQQTAVQKMTQAA